MFDDNFTESKASYLIQTDPFGNNLYEMLSVNEGGQVVSQIAIYLRYQEDEQMNIKHTQPEHSSKALLNAKHMNRCLNKYIVLSIVKV